jgi:hypothetical protein
VSAWGLPRQIYGALPARDLLHRQRPMLRHDESHHEYQVTFDRQRSPSAPPGDAQGLEEQIRDTVEALRLKLDNLRLYLSWRK